ncbi:MAG: hypothetical protein JO199_09990 [Candidatus Eremiobacteraeota bacterium]|nr:hypothetical protein [Candidatus Eremiobacteraeota bacterium]
MKFARIIAALLALCSLPLVAAAQTPATNSGASAAATMTAKIVAIDHDARVITLMDAKGNEASVKCGPEVTRFDAMKVGDTVTMTYQESVEVAIAKAGTAPAPQSTPIVTRAPGDKPGGTISQTQTAQFTIQAIDPKAPSITVKGPDGHLVSMLVKDPASIAGLKPGDVVQITYTQALAISVQ